MSEEHPGEPKGDRMRTRARTVRPQNGSDQRALLLLLGMALGATPLVVAVILQRLIGVSDAVLGAMALLSIGLVVIATVLFRPQAERERAQYPPTGQGGTWDDGEAGTEEPVSLDPLTGLLTFQPFSQRLHDEFQLSKRYDVCAALVLVDVNHLGQINRQFGTEAGDQVLRLVAGSLEKTKRMTDIAARMGDDEFGVLLLECDASGAAAFIDRLQECLARDSITVQRGGRSTSIWIGVCAGYAICSAEAADAGEILTAAVDMLEHARTERDKRRERWERSA